MNSISLFCHRSSQERAKYIYGDKFQEPIDGERFQVSVCLEGSTVSCTVSVVTDRRLSITAHVWAVELAIQGGLETKRIGVSRHLYETGKKRKRGQRKFGNSACTAPSSRAVQTKISGQAYQKHELVILTLAATGWENLSLVYSANSLARVGGVVFSLV